MTLIVHIIICISYLIVGFGIEQFLLIGVEIGIHTNSMCTNSSTKTNTNIIVVFLHHQWWFLKGFVHIDAVTPFNYTLGFVGRLWRNCILSNDVSLIKCCIDSLDISKHLHNIIITGMVLDTYTKWNNDIEIVINFFICSSCVSICKCWIYFWLTNNYFRLINEHYRMNR